MPVKNHFTHVYQTYKDMYGFCSLISNQLSTTILLLLILSCRLISVDYAVNTNDITILHNLCYKW